MDHSTQQNAAMVEQTSAAARNLSSEVSSLAEQASRFTVGAATAVRPAARPAPTHSPSRPAKPVARNNSTYVSPVKALPIATPVASGGDEDWTSF
jgi:methyl-accepting chemotaxis protein